MDNVFDSSPHPIPSTRKYSSTPITGQPDIEASNSIIHYPDSPITGCLDIQPFWPDIGALIRYMVKNDRKSKQPVIEAAGRPYIGDDSISGRQISGNRCNEHQVLDTFEVCTIRFIFFRPQTTSIKGTKTNFILGKF